MSLIGESSRYPCMPLMLSRFRVSLALRVCDWQAPDSLLRSLSFSTRPTHRILVFIARLSNKIPQSRQGQASATHFLFLFCFACFLLLPDHSDGEPRHHHSSFRFCDLCVSPAVSLLFNRSSCASPSTALRLATVSSVLASASLSLAITFTKPF